MDNSFNYPHVKIHGDISCFKSDIEVVFMGHANVDRSRDWKKENMPLSVATDVFCQHPIGSKKGAAFVPGSLAEGRRSSKSLEFNDFMVLDIDDGTPIEEFIEKVQQIGLACIIYTSHSNGKSQTKIPRDIMIKNYGFNYSDDDVLDCAEKEKQYHSSVCKGATVSKPVHSADGISLTVKHHPMAKYRAIFPLFHSYIVNDQGCLQEDAIKQWSLKVQALADKIGVQTDKACRDIARAFFFGRHAKGADFEVHLVGGKLLDFADLDIPKPKNKIRPITLREDVSYQTPWLLKFLAKRGRDLDIEAVFESYGEILTERSSGTGYEAICPFDDEHTNQGESGFFITNNDEENGNWFAKCMHNACSERDRATFLDRVIVDNELTWEDLVTFCCDRGIADSTSDALKSLRSELEENEPIQLPDGYSEKDGSIWINQSSKGSDGNDDVELCDLLIPVGKAKNLDGQSYSLIVRIDTGRGQENMIVPIADIHNDERKIRALFADQGFFIDPIHGRKFASFLARVVRMEGIEEKVLLTGPGFFEDHIALPSGFVLGEHAERYLPKYEPRSSRWQKGTLSESINIYELIWLHGSNTMRFAILMAAAAMLLTYLGEEAFAVAFTGESAKGKTSALNVGASFNGSPNGNDGSTFVTMRNTENSFELILERCSGTLSCLDETKQFQGNTQQLFFMITGGTGKGRMNADSSEKPVKRFIGATLVSSEIGMDRIVRKNNDDPVSGMFARVFDLDISSQNTIPTATYRQIMDGIKSNYGFGCIKFGEELLLNDPDKLRNEISEIANDFLLNKGIEAPTSYEERAARKFALIELAGNLLEEAMLLPEKGPEISSVVDWAWENSAGRSDLRYGDLVGNAVNRLRTTIASKLGREILPIDEKEGPRYHEVKAWHDLGKDTLYLPIDLVEEWSGGNDKCASIQKRLKKMGVIIPSGGNNIAWETIPGVVTTRHYRIKLSKFLGTDQDSE